MSDYQERQKRIVIQVFNYQIYVILSSDPNAARAKRNRILGEWTHDDNMAALHCGDSDPTSYVFLPFEADIGLVVHESCHCFWRIMEFIGAKFEDEVMAYSISHITRETVKFIAKTGNPAKTVVETKVISQVSNRLTLNGAPPTIWEYLKPLYKQYANSRAIRHPRAA